MWPVEVELNRYLTLIRNKIRERGFTQLEVQEALGWGRSYISQLLTKQKSLRVEQVLLILKVIGVDPVEFFAELYAWREPPAAASGPARAPLDPEQAEEQQQELRQLRGLLHGLVELLSKKQMIDSEELTVAVEAAEREP